MLNLIITLIAVGICLFALNDVDAPSNLLVYQCNHHQNYQYRCRLHCRGLAFERFWYFESDRKRPGSSCLKITCW